MLYIILYIVFFRIFSNTLPQHLFPSVKRISALPRCDRVDNLIGSHGRDIDTIIRYRSELNVRNRKGKHISCLVSAILRNERGQGARKGERAGHDVGREVWGATECSRGAQVAQHGGETGEANDWCRLHGLALQLSVLPSLNSPHAVYLPADAGPLPLAPLSTYAAKQRIYISIRSSFDDRRYRRR